MVIVTRFQYPMESPNRVERAPLDSTQGAGTPSISISNGGERAARNRVELSTQNGLIEK